MAMKMTINEFLGTEDITGPSPDVIAAKMTLDVQADAFMRMKQLGIKQKDLAVNMGISPAAVSKLLSAGVNMRFSSVARLASALGCDVIPPRLVPFAEHANEQSSSTLSSGMTVTLKIDHGRMAELRAKCDKRDSIDDEYRELCTRSEKTRGIEAFGDVVLGSVGDLLTTGVAS